MKTAILDSFLKFYVMGSPGNDLFGISHVKVDLIPVLKMCVLPMLEIFDLSYRICTMWWVLIFIPTLSTKFHQVQKTIFFPFSTHVQGASLQLSPALLQFYCCKGVTVEVTHPVPLGNMTRKNGYKITET